MPSFRCSDMVILKQHRVRSSTYNDHTVYQNSSGKSRPVSVSSKTRRSTRISVPPTLINTSNEVLQNILRVQPTIFFYNEENFEEACYRSVEEIRAVKDDECLWIDVTGVSVQIQEKTNKRTFLFVFVYLKLTLYRYMIMSY